MASQPARPNDYAIEAMPLTGPVFERAIGVYAAAFREPPYEDKSRGRAVRDRLRGPHPDRPGFHALVARSGEEVLGLAYGYHSDEGQWWYDHVRPEVAARLGPGAAAFWFDNAYELVEVAVHPSHQGRGIGRALILALMQDRGERTSLLSTRIDSDAHVLYGRLGYKSLIEVRFWSGDAPYYVMGARLPLRGAAEAGRTSLAGTMKAR